MVVNHSGQYFPPIRLLQDASEEYNKVPKAQKKNAITHEAIDKLFYFDKVLADVPCTGDGAMRKLPMKWKSWSVKDGADLHPLQLQIAMRAIQMTKVGGLILYSTCSLNPVEVSSIR